MCIEVQAFSNRLELLRHRYANRCYAFDQHIRWRALCALTPCHFVSGEIWVTSDGVAFSD